jgi:hypothetical protein
MKILTSVCMKNACFVSTNCVWAHSETTSYRRNIRLIRTWHSPTLSSATHQPVAGSCVVTMPCFLRHLHLIDTNQKQNASAALIPSGCTVVFLRITKLCYTGTLSGSLHYRFDSLLWEISD